MELLILSKNNKQQTKNRNRSWPRRADLGFPRGKGEGEGCMGPRRGVGVGCKPFYLEWMGNGILLYRTGKCVWLVTSLCSRTWWNIINQLYINDNNNNKMTLYQAKKKKKKEYWVEFPVLCSRCLLTNKTQFLIVQTICTWNTLHMPPIRCHTHTYSPKTLFPPSKIAVPLKVPMDSLSKPKGLPLHVCTLRGPQKAFVLVTIVGNYYQCSLLVKI